MSKRKKKKLTTEEKVAQAKSQIEAQRKTNLTVDDLPKWAQGAALTRFSWGRLIGFLPLLLAVLTVPMLQTQIPVSLSNTNEMVNKNILFLIPFACLLTSYGCWWSIKMRRRANFIKDENKFAVMEIQTFVGEIIMIAIAVAVLLYLLFVAFH